MAAPMILDTHVATKQPKGYGLSEPVRQRGYSGRLYSEANKQDRPTASWGNLDSFWPTPAALRRMLEERDWDVYTLTPYYLPTRTFFLCQPRGLPARTRGSEPKTAAKQPASLARRLRRKAGRVLRGSTKRPG